MKRVSNVVLFTVIAALAVVASFDAVAGSFAAALVADPELILAPVAAATLPESIRAQLERIRSEAIEPIEGIRCNLQTVEQKLAQIEQDGGFSAPLGGHGFPTVGATAVRQLFNEDTSDPGLQRAADAARQNKKIGQFAARVNIAGSIRAALTNTGSGSSEANGFPTPADWRPGIYGPVIPAPRLLDVLPHRPTDSNAVEYLKLDLTGDADEQEAEGDEKAELQFSGTKDIAQIATIAGWTAASKQVLADNAALQAAIDRTIRLKVLSRLENRIINGVGGDGRIYGLLNQATAFIPTIGTSTADQIGEGLMRLSNYGYAPNLVILNPMDFFEDVQIKKNPTTGEYMFGDPTKPQGPTLWNTSIVRTPAMPQGQGLILDTSTVTVLDREEMSIAISNSHADFFIRNLVAILGELRAGLEVIDTNAVWKFDVGNGPSSGP